ncbi:uncharacterized protein LOC132039067 [Lycium ferocissimum]|uniref:uncharacterized protein LOC132039067 n=1 Tax=Lycium ferocissimum TaxID=112874 RepID=UPI002815998E|nr:uncharacterized protein LOC132039067 [Lycium ferocissimum]
MESRRAKLKITKVLWDFPPTGWIMCNTDGASRGNPGISSYAFCLRDELGDLIYAKAEGIGEATNIEAEMMAIKEALRYCRDMDFNKVIIQTDSQMIQKIMTEVWKPPWHISNWVDEAKDFASNKESITAKNTAIATILDRSNNINKANHRSGESRNKFITSKEADQVTVRFMSNDSAASQLIR